jgi:Ala-tRNA(Pro) deacylase
MAQLGVTPGSVSPFGLIHEGSGGVQVIVDEALRGDERLLFHPNINTASVTISAADLDRFLATRPNRVRWLRL